MNDMEHMRISGTEPSSGILSQTMLFKTNQLKSTVELGYMCPRGLTGPPAVTLTK